MWKIEHFVDGTWPPVNTGPSSLSIGKLLIKKKIIPVSRKFHPQSSHGIKRRDLIVLPRCDGFPRQEEPWVWMISSSTGQVQQKLPIPKEYGFRFGACDDHCSYMRPGHLLIFSMRQNEPTLESPWEWKWVICCYDENLQSST